MRTREHNWTHSCIALSFWLHGCAGEMGSLNQASPQPGSTEAGPEIKNVAPNIQVINPTDAPQQQSSDAASNAPGGFQLQSLALNFEANDIPSIQSARQADIVRVTKPELGAHVFMSCDGTSWVLADASQSVYELSAATLSVAGTQSYCDFQVAKGRLWSLQKRGQKTELSYGQVQSNAGDRATFKSVILQIPSQTDQGTLSDPLLPLAVNADNVVFFFDTVLQFYELTNDSGTSRSKRDSSISVTQINWDRASKGDPIAASRIGRGYWVATKTHLHWLKPIDGSSGSTTGHTWLSQSLTFDGYSRKDLAALKILGMGLNITEGDGQLALQSRASLLLPGKVSISPDFTWERDIAPIAQEACASCHGKNSKRPWVNASDADSWTETWRADLEERINDLSMPPRSSREAEAFTVEKRQTLLAWLQALGSDLSDTLDAVGEAELPTAGVGSPGSSAPGSGNSAAPSEEELHWEETILPVLEANCLTSGCHTSGTQIATYADFVEEKDTIRGALTGAAGVTQMPLGNSSALSQSDRSAILSYIEDEL
jgi:mono/diheme cytochrome c family protein